MTKEALKEFIEDANPPCQLILDRETFNEISLFADNGILPELKKTEPLYKHHNSTNAMYLMYNDKRLTIYHP